MSDLRELEYSKDWTNPEDFPSLTFTKDWESQDDFPTIETDETQVRADMQYLYNEIRDYVNGPFRAYVVATGAAEDNRQGQEEQREANEAARVEAETARVEAETARVSAENARNVWEDYSASKAYAVGNKVAYGGSSYLCIKPCTGIAPPNAEYWRLIAAKGNDGKGAPADDTPKAAGTANAGVLETYSRGDHVHPKEVSDADRAAWDGKAAATHASQHGKDGADPITPDAIGAIASTAKGTAGGVASLGADGKVPASQLPETDTYTKDEILKDTTAEKYGMDNTAVPDDLFALLKDSVLRRTLSDAGSLYWEKLPNFPNVDRPMLACTNSVVMVVPYYHNTSKDGYRSKDGGETWEKINLPITNISEFAAVHGFFIAVTNGVCCYSSDGGDTWTQKSSTNNAEAYACWGGSRFVFVDSFGYSYFTDDFKTVTRGGSLTQGCYVVCCGDNGRIVTLGVTNGNTAKAAYSDDEGATWTNVSRPDTSVANSINSIAYLPGVGFISVAADGNRVLISETGESWQIHPINGTTLNTANNSLHLTVVGDTLFASCQLAAIAWTKDGKNWTSLNMKAEWLVYVENQNSFILSTGMRGGFASELTDIFKNLLKIPISQINGFSEPLEYGTYTGTGRGSTAIFLTKKRKLLVVTGENSSPLKLGIAIIVLPDSGTSLCGFGAMAQMSNTNNDTNVMYNVTVNDRTVAISVNANSYNAILSLDEMNTSYSYVAIG